MRNRMRHNPPCLGITNRDAVCAEVRREIVREEAEEVGHLRFFSLSCARPLKLAIHADVD